MKMQKGFTLIELMIVVAIIAILSAIALPAYNNYRVKSSNNACLAEAKAYMNSYVSAVKGGFTTAELPAYTPKACTGQPTGLSTVAAEAAPPAAADVTFTAQQPGGATVSCFNATASCSLP